MKKLLLGIALVFGSFAAYAAPVTANLTEVQVASINGENFLSMKIDRDAFMSTCPKFVAERRIYIPLQEDIASGVLASQALNALDAGTPIAIEKATACNELFGQEVKRFTFVRNIKFEYELNRRVYNKTSTYALGRAYKNNAATPIRITVHDGRKGTYNCDLKGYTGSASNNMYNISSSTIGDGAGKDQVCSVSFEVAPNSWWQVNSNPTTDYFPKECPPANRASDVFEEYRYKTWYGKKKYHQNLKWGGVDIFRSCGSCWLPHRSGSYVYKDQVYKYRDNHTLVYSVCRQRDPRTPTGSGSYALFVEQ